MKRSSHIAVKVRPDQLEAATAHYQNLLGLKVIGSSAGGVELEGENFFLFVEPSESPVVLQEFIAEDGKSARSRIGQAGCQIFEESDMGFHVTDPYGMSYHVWTADPARVA